MGRSRASAQAVSPWVMMTQDRMMTDARRGVRFFFGFLVLPDGTQPWTRPVIASIAASRCATAYSTLSRSISGRQPGTMSGSAAMDSIAGAIGR